MMKLTLRQVLLWLTLVVGAVYAASLTSTYHFDDSHSVETNLAIRSLANIPHFWTDPKTSSFIPENRVYRPLVYTLYAVCWWLGKGATWPFHLMKMAMHVGVCLALFAIWRRLWSTPGWLPVKNLKFHLPFTAWQWKVDPTLAALALATLFAIHPAGSECVIYISATTSLQCALFYLAAFWAYLRHRDDRRGASLKLSLGLYFLSVASKEEGITLCAMVFLTELFLQTERPWSARLLPALKTAAPYVVTGAFLATWIVLMRPGEGDESRGYATSLQYFITQWRAYLWYMRLWFWPFDLNADNAMIEFSKDLRDPLVWQAAIGNSLLIGAAWVNRRRFPAFLYGLVWFYVTISPASSVVVLAEAVNEHRMYLAYLGFVGGTFTLLLAAAEGWMQPERRAQRLGWAFLAIASGLVIGTTERNRVWANDENLWRDTVEKNPTSGRALNNLALVHMARADYSVAIHLLERCEQHWTTYAYCPLNRGISYLALGQGAERLGKGPDAVRAYDEAEKALLRAYALNPRNVHVNFNLGRIHEEVRKNYAKASEFFRAALDLTGGRYPAAELRIAACLAAQGKWSEADAAFDRLIAQQPGDPTPAFERGRVELDHGNAERAWRTYSRFLSEYPRHLQAWYNSGVAAVRLEKWKDARAAFEKTVELDPRSEQGWYNLAFARDKTGDGPGAVAAMKRLVEINAQRPDYAARLREYQAKYGP